jgi:hypothetical protein
MSKEIDLDSVRRNLKRGGFSACNADGAVELTDERMVEVLEAIADEFHDHPDGPWKTARAMSLLGRSGPSMIPLLNLGSGGLRAMRNGATNAGYAQG